MVKLWDFMEEWFDHLPVNIKNGFWLMHTMPDGLDYKEYEDCMSYMYDKLGDNFEKVTQYYSDDLADMLCEVTCDLSAELENQGYLYLIDEGRKERGHLKESHFALTEWLIEGVVRERIADGFTILPFEPMADG